MSLYNGQFINTQPEVPTKVQRQLMDFVERHATHEEPDTDMSEQTDHIWGWLAVQPLHMLVRVDYLFVERFTLPNHGDAEGDDPTEYRQFAVAMHDSTRQRFAEILYDVNSGITLATQDFTVVSDAQAAPVVNSLLEHEAQQRLQLTEPQSYHAGP